MQILMSILSILSSPHHNNLTIDAATLNMLSTPSFHHFPLFIILFTKYGIPSFTKKTTSDRISNIVDFSK